MREGTINYDITNWYSLSMLNRLSEFPRRAMLMKIVPLGGATLLVKRKYFKSEQK